MNKIIRSKGFLVWIVLGIIYFSIIISSPESCYVGIGCWPSSSVLILELPLIFIFALSERVLNLIGGYVYFDWHLPSSHAFFFSFSFAVWIIAGLLLCWLYKFSFKAEGDEVPLAVENKMILVKKHWKLISLVIIGLGVFYILRAYHLI